MRSRIYAVLFGWMLFGWGLTEASAQAPWPSLGWHSPVYYGYEYQIGNIPTPPYFAIHPPVYYGRRTTMTYGDSPFPHPVDRGPCHPPVIGRCHPPVNMARPAGMMIVNPYVETESSPAKQGQRNRKSRDKRKASDEADSLHIVANPYVISDGTNKLRESTERH